MTAPQTISSKLAKELDILQQKYNDIFETSQDIKTLQGVERCIELKMKIAGIDGKQQPVVPQKREPNLTLDLSKLSQNTLQEILKLSDIPKLSRNPKLKT